MPAANYTEEDLKYLDEAIASGELKSKHQDRYVEYRDLDEMLRIRQVMVDAINENKTGAKPVRKSFRLCVDSGL